MKRFLTLFAVAVAAICITFVSCKKDASNPLVGVYDLDMQYDSITTSDGTWFSNEFFEQMTGKTNPPKHGTLTIAEGENGKLTVTAALVNDATGEEKQFFSTTATETDGILTIDDCSSDYYYATIEEMIRFTFHGFTNNLPEIYFKGIYTVNLGYDYSYLNSYYCTKRK